MSIEAKNIENDVTQRIELPGQAAFEPPWMRALRAKIGEHEIAGPQDNPFVVQMFIDAGFGRTHDETAWCGVTQGYAMRTVGIKPPPGCAAARNWSHFGEAVSFEDAMPGDIVVLWRDDPNGPHGHVTQFVRHRADGLFDGLGGNQGNKICEAAYPKARVLCVRRVTQEMRQAAGCA